MAGGGNTSILTEFLHAILVQVIRVVIKSSVPAPSFLKEDSLPSIKLTKSTAPAFLGRHSLVLGFVSKQKFISKRLRELGRALIIVTSEIKNKDAL